MVAATSAGCVREYPADHWIPGVRCDGEICLAEQPDRLSTTFTLAPDCWQDPADAEAGINAQRMTLMGAGDQIVFAGMRSTNPDATPSKARIAIAEFDSTVAGDGACPKMNWPVAPGVALVANGAHVVGPDGRFWSFVGDIGGTQGAMAYDPVSSWVPHPVASPSPPVDDDQNWNAPNGLAIALPGNSVAIVRSVASNDSKTTDLIPSLLERWTFGPDRTPVRVAQTQIESGTLAYAAMLSTRGQLRLFPVESCPADDPNGELGNRLVALGDFGWALALPDGDLPAVPIAARQRAAANDKRTNLGSASVLLPLRLGSTYAPGSVLYIGGGDDGDTNPERRQRMDLFEPACGTWTPAGNVLPSGRNFATPVLLPDGTILLAGDAQGAHEVFYIDPQRGFAITVGHASISRTRGIGVGGLVLADGRVVLAGGNATDEDQVRARPDVDLWEPPYLHDDTSGTRPMIASLSGSIHIDQPFSIQMNEGPAITEVVLLAYGSSFMGNNPNQRLVQLAIESNDPHARMIELRGPPAGWAPAGRYLLFALTADRIPSQGVPVDVVDSAAAP